jgi:hypothetical protein
MKLLAGFLALVLGSSVAAADHAAPAWKERARAKFDTDHDGVLSPEERWVARRAIKRHRMERRMARRFDRLVARFDRDGDGVLGPGEAPPRLVRKLRALDRNGDGWLTRDELPARRRGQRQGDAGPPGSVPAAP